MTDLNAIFAKHPDLKIAVSKHLDSQGWELKQIILKAYETGAKSTEMISPKAIDLIKHFESLHDGDLTMIGLQPKMDSVGIWTMGWGRAMRDPSTGDFLKGAANKAKAYKLATIHTEAEATEALSEDLGQYERTARMKLGTTYWDKLNADQKGALTSFVYNCGTGKPKDYKIFANIKLYVDQEWNVTQMRAYWDKSVIKAGGKVQPGLVRRRKSEAELFLTGRLNFFQ